MRRRFKDIMEFKNDPSSEKRRRLQNQTIFALTTGLICGFVIGYLFTVVSSLFRYHTPCTLEYFHPYNSQITIPTEMETGRRERFLFRMENTIAKKYYENVKILCFVFTTSQYHTTRAKTVKNTWGKRCSKLIFFSNVHNGELPTIILKEEPGVNKHWNKTLEALDYLYSHHYYDADWFIKADDTNYVILENLRFLLSHYSSTEEYYLGCKYRYESIPQGFMVEKAGYVLSRATLQKIAVVVIPHYGKILPGDMHTYRTDIKLGYLLARLDVKVIDSRDKNGKERFHPFDPKTHVYEVKTDNAEMHEWWGSRYYQDVPKNGVAGCSDTAISFSYMSPAQMYAMEYMVYNLRPYGMLRY